MLYFKHTDLADKYHVSLKTVHNWIDAAKQGKLKLTLHEKSGRFYVANNPGNLVELEKLVEQGKKYRNSRFHKAVSPKEHFYELYSPRQILDIISNLDIHREIPRQYNYFNGGAQNWDKFANRMHRDKGPNLLKSTIELLDANLGSIDKLLGQRKMVNVIDIGPGNALPVRGLLAHLLEQGILHRYIAIDISEEMLHITERNIKEWFGDKVPYEGHVKDITYDRFDDLIVHDMLDKHAKETVNLALFLGGTPMNFRSPGNALKVICNSLGHDDLLIYSDKPDSEAERQYFDVNADIDNNTGPLSSKYAFILDLLGVDQSLYYVEMGFNEPKHMRYIRIRLKNALTISFRHDEIERDVNLEKGDVILLLRVWHMSASEIVAEFEQSGLALLQSSLTRDREYLLTVFGVDAKNVA